MGPQLFSFHSVIWWQVWWQCQAGSQIAGRESLGVRLVHFFVYHSAGLFSARQCGSYSELLRMFSLPVLILVNNYIARLFTKRAAEEELVVPMSDTWLTGATPPAPFSLWFIDPCRQLAPTVFNVHKLLFYNAKCRAVHRAHSRGMSSSLWTNDIYDKSVWVGSPRMKDGPFTSPYTQNWSMYTHIQAKHKGDWLCTHLCICMGTHFGNSTFILQVGRALFFNKYNIIIIFFLIIKYKKIYHKI